MKKILAIFLLGTLVSCSWVSNVYITGFIWGFNPEAKYDVKIYGIKSGRDGSFDSVEIKNINKLGWFELNPDSASTANILRWDSAQFRMLTRDTLVVLTTIRTWDNLYRQTLIDDQGIKYSARYRGRGVSYVDNLQIGIRN